MSSPYSPISELMQKLSPPVLAELQGYFEPRSYEKGEHLLMVGQICNHLFLVLQGAVRHFRITERGEEMNTWFSFENDVVSILESTLFRTPSESGLMALEKSQVIALHINHLQLLQKKYHEFETFTRKMTESYMIFTEKRSYSMQEHDAIGRYKELILLNPKVESRVSQTHIASYLGIKKETLSRLKKKL